MSQSPFNEHGQFAWDSTSLKLAETCPRKYYYKMVEGWQPFNKSVHLVFGGHYATALEHYYKHIAEGMDREEAIVEVVLEALINTWEYEYEEDEGAGRRPIPGTGSPWESLDNNKTRFTLIRSIIWYFDHFAEDATEVVTLADGKPAVEYTFKLPLENGLLFCGHLDRLVQYEGDYYVMDQKTTKTTISPNYFNQYSTDTQMSGYTFAGKAIFHLPVKGVIIDAAQIAVGFTRYERGFTFRTEAVLDEWYEDMLRLIEVTSGYYKSGYFPMNRSACNNYGGCEFRDICSRPASLRDQFLRGAFEKGKIWNPLESR